MPSNSSQPNAASARNALPQSFRSRVTEGVGLWAAAWRASTHDDSIFIWIPKNAGSSVYTLLHGHGLVKLKTIASVQKYFRNSGRVTFGHIDLGALVDAGLVDQAFVDGAFKFAITRNPYSRSVSLYRYLLQYVMRDWREQPDFGAFLRLLADGNYDKVGLYNSRGLSQCNPQVEWLRYRWPDKLYRVEELGEFVSGISDLWHIPKTQIPHVNASPAPANFELEREEKALIDKVYAEDFEMIGYSTRKLPGSKA